MNRSLALILAIFAAATGMAATSSAQVQQSLEPALEQAPNGSMDTSWGDQEKEEPKVDSAKVRHGKLADVDLKKDKIAVVDSKKVYLQIPAYKTIVKDKIKTGSARYIKLMEEATALYRTTLEKIANKESVKLIVEVGGVSGVKTTDLTDAIIDAL